MNKQIITLFLSFLFCQFSFAQGFKVKEFKQNINDGSAFHAPLDLDGHPCGLIKVRTDCPDLQFDGDVVGKVEYKMNEYLVYVSQVSSLLKISHPNYLPLVVPYMDYGISMSPKATYILTLDEKKFKKEKTGVTITAKPIDAELFINDILIDNISGNGFYQLYLPKGEYVCRIEQQGYRPNVQMVSTGKTTQNLNVELESVMAELEVKCKSGTAEIYIDGELKGNGSWKGAILAGEHQIEAKQQNFESYNKTISVAEKECRIMTIPELKRSMGKLQIVTTPVNLPVNVDGKYVGMSPCVVDLETGNHYVSCKTYAYKQYRTDVEILSGKQTALQVMMEMDKDIDDYDKSLYVKAYKGNQEAIKELAENIIGSFYRGSSDPLEAIFWLERYSRPEELLDFEAWISAYCEVGNPEKALDLFYSIKSKVEHRGDFFLSESYMKDIGNAFLKKNEIDKAIQCFEKAGEDGYEGLGDCYKAKGNKQLAASYYRKYLDKDNYGNRKSVEKKLKELGY